MGNHFHDWLLVGYDFNYRTIRRLEAQEELGFVSLAKDGDLSAREKLIIHHLPLLKMVAQRYTEKGLSLGELINEGTFGLVRAIERFDTERKCRFGTYAKWWIRDAIEQALLNQGRLVRLPAHMERALREKYRADAQGHCGVTPTGGVGIIAGGAGCVQELSSHDGYSESESGWDPPAETNVDDIEELTPETVFSFKQHLELLSKGLAQLSDRERVVVVRRFGLYNDTPETLQCLAADLGISCERTRQIQKSALAKLRSFLDPYYAQAD